MCFQQLKELNRQVDKLKRFCVQTELAMTHLEALYTMTIGEQEIEAKKATLKKEKQHFNETARKELSWISSQSRTNVFTEGQLCLLAYLIWSVMEVCLFSVLAVLLFDFWYVPLSSRNFCFSNCRAWSQSAYHLMISQIVKNDYGWKLMAIVFQMNGGFKKLLMRTLKNVKNLCWKSSSVVNNAAKKHDSCYKSSNYRWNPAQRIAFTKELFYPLFTLSSATFSPFTLFFVVAVCSFWTILITIYPFSITDSFASNAQKTFDAFMGKYVKSYCSIIFS